MNRRPVCRRWRNRRCWRSVSSRAELALSQLARRYGDRNGALRAIERLFALPGEDRDARDDPWWWYYVAQARDAEDLLEATWEPYRAERLQ